MSVHILFSLLILVTCISAMPPHRQPSQEDPRPPSAQSRPPSQITVSSSGSIKAVKAANQLLEELVAKGPPESATSYSFPSQDDTKEREQAQRATESTDTYKIALSPTIDFDDANTLLSREDQTILLPDALEHSELKSRKLRNEEIAKISQNIQENFNQSVATLDQVRDDEEPKCHTSNIMGRTTAMPQREPFELSGAEDVGM